MSTTSHIHRGALVVAATVATLAFAVAAPARASYAWPLKPFHQQHAVRGFFGDPRIAGNDEAHGTIHFGIDISAPNGTPVYATVDGIASIHPLHRDTVIVSARAGVAHEYWHVIPAIVRGQRVVAYKTVVGRVETPWAHVHFSEMCGGRYVNPIRPGALSPYRDTTAPSVGRIVFEHAGAAAGNRLSGSGDLVAEAFDFPSLAPPGPWCDAPLTPALVQWRLIGLRGVRGATSGWHVAADFRGFLPTWFGGIYARGTRQNHPDLNHRLGRYRFLLAHGFDTRSLPNGAYRLVVRAFDTRGNVGASSETFTIANGV